MPDTVKLNVKWSGQEFALEFADSDTLADVRQKLEECSGVAPKRQKLLGLKTKANKPAEDGDTLSSLAMKPGLKVMMIGTSETVIQATQKEAEAAPQVQDDFDLTEEQQGSLEVKDQPEVQEKLARRLRSVEVKILNPPRPGKKCLVLDIDYTLFDLGSSAERPEELARPYLHEFLAAAWEHYDIIIWSATGMKWVEVKMKELGVSTHPAYKLVCMLDHSAMLTVSTEKYGVFECKPLAFIWSKFPGQYHEHNTIMFDDLRRNYIMNKQAGLVIRPFKRAHLTRHTDKELYHLTRYLLLIAPLERISHLDHSRWERYLAKHGG
ncbi:HAD-like domain-containing protein [Haematococcus lacustris]